MDELAPFTEAELFKAVFYIIFDSLYIVVGGFFNILYLLSLFRSHILVEVSEGFENLLPSFC